jgi:hypothetical protein
MFLEVRKVFHKILGGDEKQTFLNKHTLTIEGVAWDII